jgi:hypothetical protein
MLIIIINNFIYDLTNKHGKGGGMVKKNQQRKGKIESGKK